jgi:hypothetical protein
VLTQVKDRLEGVALGAECAQALGLRADGVQGFDVLRQAIDMALVIVVVHPDHLPVLEVQPDAIAKRQWGQSRSSARRPKRF